MTHRKYDGWNKLYGQRQGVTKQTAHAQLDIRALQASWQAFDAMAHLRPIHNDIDSTAESR